MTVDTLGAGGAVVEAALARDAPRPLHAQISDQLDEKIASGEWPSHYKLPAEPDLAHDLGVSRGTVRRALTTLMDRGRLARVHGRGTFVISSGIEQPMSQELLSLAEALDRQGLAFVTTVLATRDRVPPARIGALLSLRQGEDVLYLSRRRQVGAETVALLHNFVRHPAAADLTVHDFSRERLFEVIEQAHGQPIHSARRTFEAVAATGELAAEFGVGAGAPLLYLEQITYLADGRPVEYSDVWIRGDQLKLSSVLTRRASSPDSTAHRSA